MDNLEKLKIEYEKLRKLHNLPSFEEMEKEFEISAIKIDEAGILIKTLLRSISSKLGYYANLLEPVAAPMQPSLHTLIESNNISDENKQEIQIFYKYLNKLLHEYLYVETGDDKDIGKFINKIFKEFPKIKEKERKFLKMIHEAWEKEEKIKTKTPYTG